MGLRVSVCMLVRVDYGSVRRAERECHDSDNSHQRCKRHAARVQPAPVPGSDGRGTGWAVPLQTTQGNCKKLTITALLNGTQICSLGLIQKKG